MGASVLVDDDFISAEDVFASGRRSLRHQGVGYHDGVVRSLGHEVVVQRGRRGVVAVADDLAVHGADAVGRSHQAVVAVLEGRHAVVHMGHGPGAVGVGHHSLLIGGGGMPDADHHAVLCQVTGEGKVIVRLRSHGDVFDMSFGCFLIVLELLDGGLYDILLGLGSLVDHVQIGPLEMDAEDLRALIAVLHDLRHVGDGVRQNLLALGDGGGQEGGHALGHDVLRPVA